LKSPPYLDRRVKELNLGLGPASPTQVLRLMEPAIEPAVNAGPPQYAAGQNATAPIP